ncbi:hypothetical protein BDY24DRAFT_405882 [Mrakia frigida]|uniref:Vam7p n=1 Tax=Mrakia frigida TaxID=29902 RepID=UPI003FCC1731
MSIQSITIPSYETRLNPKAHTAYRIQISTPVRTWDVYRRYSDFESLVQELKSETGRDVEGEGLPGKHGWSLRRSVDDVKLIEERRTSLESYLRHILSHKEKTWRSSHAFLDFLAAPPLPPSIQTNPSSSSRTTTPLTSSLPAPPTSFTSPTFLSEHSTLQTLSRSIRSHLSKRDALLSSGNTSGGHTAGIQAKKELAVLLNRVGGLARGLEEISKKENVGEGEMRRRSEMVARLQDDCLSLGKLSATAVRRDISEDERSGGGGGRREAAPGSQRSALLGGGGGGGVPTVRTFGAAPKGVETEETRPLDGGGLMHLQQTKINDQDSMLKQLSTILQRQQIIGQAIGQEISEQNELLDKLDEEVDRTGAKMGKAKRQMNRLN